MHKGVRSLLALGTTVLSLWPGILGIGAHPVKLNYFRKD